MLRRIRERSGTAGFAIGVAALVLALAGGAYAAAKLNSSQKKEVKAIATKVAKKYQGSGPQGPVGPAGKNGAAGPEGKQGLEGKEGKEGTPGKSVKVSEIASGLEPCSGRGGAEVKEEGASEGVEVCNGAQGPEGQPWTPNNTLPAGAAETGVWSFQADSGEAYAPISLAIPLGREVTAPEWLGPNELGNTIHFKGETNFTDFDEGGSEKLGCTGSAGFPLAPPGHFCIYKSTLSEATFNGPWNLGIGSHVLQDVGGLLGFTVTAPGALGSGSFAIKAPCAQGEEIVEVPEVPGTSPVEFICKKSA